MILYLYSNGALNVAKVGENMEIINFRVEEFYLKNNTYLLHGTYKTYEQAERKCKKLLQDNYFINLRIVKRMTIIDETIEQIFRKRRIK